VPDLDKEKALKDNLEASAPTKAPLQGMTFLRLVPHDFDTALHHVKRLRKDHIVSLTLKTHEIKTALPSYLQAADDRQFIKRREFLIHDLVELASIYAETQHASVLLVDIHAVFEPLQPFLPHDGLRLIYDTIPSEIGWAIFRMNGLRSKLSKDALYVDLSVLEFEEAGQDDRATHDIAFLARLEDYKRELSEHGELVETEMSLLIFAKWIDVQFMMPDQDSKDAEELREAAEGTFLEPSEEEEGSEGGESDEPEEEEDEGEEAEGEEAEGEEAEGEEAEGEEAEGEEAEGEEAEGEEAEGEEAEGEEAEGEEAEGEEAEEKEEPEEKEEAEGEEAEEKEEPEEKEEAEEPEEKEEAEGEEAEEKDEPEEKEEFEKNEEPGEKEEAEESKEGEETEKSEESEEKEESEKAEEPKEKEEAEESKEGEEAEKSEESEEKEESEKAEEPEEKEEAEESKEGEEAEKSEESEEKEESEKAEKPEEKEEAEKGEEKESEKETEKGEGEKESRGGEGETEGKGDTESKEGKETPEHEEREAREEHEKHEPHDDREHAEHSEHESHEGPEEREVHEGHEEYEPREDHKHAEHSEHESHAEHEKHGHPEEHEEREAHEGHEHLEEHEEHEAHEAHEHREGHEAHEGHVEHEAHTEHEREQPEKTGERKEAETSQKESVKDGKNEKPANKNSERDTDPAMKPELTGKDKLAENKANPSVDTKGKSPNQQRQQEKQAFEKTADKIEHSSRGETAKAQENIDAAFHKNASDETTTHALKSDQAIARAGNENGTAPGTAFHLSANLSIQEPHIAHSMTHKVMPGQYSGLMQTKSLYPSLRPPLPVSDILISGVAAMPPVSDRIYSIMTSNAPVDPAYVGGRFDPAYSIAFDPVHAIEAMLLKDRNLQKLHIAHNITVRYPNMNHSFGAMFAGIPLSNPEPEVS